MEAKMIQVITICILLLLHLGLLTSPAGDGGKALFHHTYSPDRHQGVIHTTWFYRGQHYEPGRGIIFFLSNAALC